jgi:hypothetical protein
MSQLVVRLMPVVALALLAIPSVAKAQVGAANSADQAETQTTIYVDENGSTYVQTNTTTVLPGGVLHQQNSSYSTQNSGSLQYRANCNNGVCQTYSLYCQPGQCEYRQVPFGNLYPLYLYFGR